jgi:hypothetical protein
LSPQLQQVRCSKKQFCRPEVPDFAAAKAATPHEYLGEEKIN